MDRLEKIHKTLVQYSQQIGAQSYEIAGQVLTPTHTFLPEGLLPIFLRRLKEVTYHGNFESLYESCGLVTAPASNGLTGETVICKNDEANTALCLLLFAEVVNNQIMITKALDSNYSGNVNLDGMLDTYSLEDLNQSQESGGINCFLKAALSDQAVEVSQ